MMAIDTATLDAWADDLGGPVALHLRQKLLPIEGEGGVFFPPTYAHGDKESPYAIDTLSNGTKIVQVDSVGSQANRMEPLFRKARDGEAANPLASLVPQVEIDLGNGTIVNILDAGHRLGDAIVRSSDLHKDAQDAFVQYQKTGDAAAIARLAPTTLVFGAWDSRDTQAKLPRVVQAVIRAWDVDPIKRSAQYNPPADYIKLDVFTEEERAKAEGNTTSPLARQGFVHVPAVGTPGGVIARGGIFRDVTVNLIALRQIGSGPAQELRRYVLGLALIAACEPQDGFLRQGCLLTLDPDAPAQWETVERSGKRTHVAMDASVLQTYARAAATAFGIGPDRPAKFLKDRAKADVKKGDPKKGKAKNDATKADVTQDDATEAGTE